MSRRTIGSVVAGVAAAGYLGTAALHSTGFGAITRLSESAAPELQAVAPALWLSFSFDLAVLGLIVAVIAARPGTGGRWILAMAGLAPISAAGLQLRFLGFMPPTAMLLGIGALAVIAAGVLPRSDRLAQAEHTDGRITADTDRMDFELRGQEQALASALKARDADAFSRLLAADYVFTSAQGETWARARAMADLTDPRLNVAHVAVAVDRVLPIGEAGVVTGRSTVEGQIGERSISGVFRFTHVWRRRDDQWEIVAGHASPAGHAG